MKISIEHTAASYLTKSATGIKNKQSAPLQETGRKFDQIMIDSNSKKNAEQRMAAAAKKDVASAVYQPVSEEKIADLKEQVSQGMYKVDPEAVAAKILLLRGEQ